MSELEGKTIVEVREMTDEEMESEHWHSSRNPLALVLDNGDILYPSQDPEGSGAGCMFAYQEDGDKIMYTR